MGDVLSSVLVLASLVGIYAFMFRSWRPKGQPAKTWADLSGYTSSSWGIALMAGFAVNDILRILTSTSGTPTTLGQLVTLGIILTVVVGWSCGAGVNPDSFLIRAPSTIIGMAAAVLKSFVTVQDAAARQDWFVVSMVFALALLFVLPILVKLGMSTKLLRGLEWYTALEMLLFLVSPFGVTLRDLAGLSPLALALLQIGLPLALAALPAFVTALFAAAVALAEVYVAFLGQRGSFTEALTFVGFSMVGYAVGVWMRRGFGWGR